jgi:hypothetical protein
MATDSDILVGWVDKGYLSRSEARDYLGYKIVVPSGGGSASGPTGGTYSTSVVHPETGETKILTWDYNKTMTDQPVSVERRPMVQQDVVTPRSPKFQFKGAKVLSYADTYMEEGHDHHLLLSYWRDHVGRTKVDTLVGTGISGALGVINLARDLGINYLIIRKQGEHAHSSQPAEGRLGKNWVFVDDLVSSGSTFAAVWDAMATIHGQTGFESKFKGVFLYANGGFITPGQSRPAKSKLHYWLTDGGSECYNGEFRSQSW